MLKRIAPALLLLIISPLIAEFLLGDFNVRQLGYLGIFVPLYGASALFIREIVRRTGRGWTTIILLGVVFGLVAEGLVNLTLFNPNYAGAKLLEYGFMPQLGTSFNYAVFIVTLHTVWSMSVPIAIAEGFAGTRHSEPWLRTSELIVAGILSVFGLGGTAVSTIKRFHFEASTIQYLSILILIILLLIIAFRLLRPHNSDIVTTSNNESKASAFGLILIVAFLLSSAFQLWFHYAPSHKINPIIGVAVFLFIDLIAILLLRHFSRSVRWGSKQRLAVAAGCVLTYGWFGIQRIILSGHSAMGIKSTSIDKVGQVILLLMVLTVCYVSYRKCCTNSN